VAHLIPLPFFGTPSLGVYRQGRGRGCAREGPSLSRSELVRGQSRSEWPFLYSLKDIEQVLSMSMYCINTNRVSLSRVS
jgi:hypothetical protein